MQTSSSSIRNKIVITIGFFSCILLAFLVRTDRYDVERKRIINEIGADFVPFTVESSMMYDYAHDVAVGKGIPARDQQLIGMDDYTVKEQMSISLEYFLGYGYRLKNLIWDTRKDGRRVKTAYEDDPDFTKWLRFQIRVWTSITTGLIFLWLVVMRCPVLLAFFGAFIHAFSPAAIARYTGQDLIRGQFALPLITAVFFFAYWVLSKPRWWKYLLLGGAAFVAMASWDMAQICFSLWCLTEIVRVLLGGTLNSKRRNLWIVVYVAVVLAAILIPYHRAHHLLLSPLVLLFLPTLLAVSVLGERTCYKRRLLVTICSVIGFVIVWRAALSVSSFAHNYSHFADLIVAKLRFGNVKPADPSLLSFDARVLWTHAMHSAKLKDVFIFFPSVLIVSSLLGVIGCLVRKVRKQFHRSMGRLLFPLLMSIFYFIGFVFIFRYHVFCVLFISIALPMLVADWCRVFRSLGMRCLFTAVVLLTVFAEAKMTFSLVRDYRIDSYVRETAGLVKWLRQAKVNDQTVLADFVLSPVLKSYCDARILLQPKYELEENRKNYREFINILYHGTEIDLNKFCAKHGIEFMVFDRGYGPLAPMHIYSPRYFAAARDIGMETPVAMMFFKKDKLRWFYRIEPPADLAFISRKYLVYRIITPEERMKAMRLAVRGEALLKVGQTRQARPLAERAFYLDPNSEYNYRLYANAFGGVVPKIEIGRYKTLFKAGDDD